MNCVGIWEPDGALSRAVRGGLTRLGLTVARGEYPDQLADVPLALLAVAPLTVGWAGAEAVRCPMVLLPGTAGALARRLGAGCTVSYGTSHRDTLTFSSLERDRVGLAVQRELVTLEGRVVERQEIPLLRPPGCAPTLLLAAAGILLLGGLPPEALEQALSP